METGNRRQTTNVAFAVTQEGQKMVTPQSVENKLVALSKEVDESHKFLEDAEYKYHTAKSDYEIAMAGSRLALGKEKLRVQDVQDIALTTNAHLYRVLNTAEATAKAARANATRIRTQVDIARSVGTSVRASLEL